MALQIDGRALYQRCVFGALGGLLGWGLLGVVAPSSSSDLANAAFSGALVGLTIGACCGAWDGLFRNRAPAASRHRGRARRGSRRTRRTHRPRRRSTTLCGGRRRVLFPRARLGDLRRSRRRDRRTPAPQSDQNCLRLLRRIPRRTRRRQHLSMARRKGRLLVRARQRSCDRQCSRTDAPRTLRERIHRPRRRPAACRVADLYVGPIGRPIADARSTPAGPHRPIGRRRHLHPRRSEPRPAARANRLCRRRLFRRSRRWVPFNTARARASPPSRASNCNPATSLRSARPEPRFIWGVPNRESFGHCRRIARRGRAVGRGARRHFRWSDAPIAATTPTPRRRQSRSRGYQIRGQSELRRRRRARRPTRRNHAADGRARCGRQPDR